MKSAKRTTIPYLKSFNIKKNTTYGVGNLGPCLGQAQTYGGVKLINVIPHS